MKYFNSSIALLFFFLVFIGGCNGQHEEEIQMLTSKNEELKSQNDHFISQMDLLIDQVHDQNSIIINLRERIQQLEDEHKELSLLENEIKYDMRIPLDVFEVIQNYFYSINNKDLQKLQATTAQNVYESRVEYINSVGYKKMYIDEMAFQSEYTYQSHKKTTETMIVRVKYQEYDNNFALQNTNNAGWKIVDID